MKNYKKLLFLLTPYERKRLLLLLIMITVIAIFDLIGIVSILPFISVLNNPNVIETNSFLNSIYQYSSIIGVVNVDQFTFVLGFFVFILLIISLSFKAIITYAQTRFIQMREYSISRRLAESYLHQPYSWFLSQHSANIGKKILSEVSQIVASGIRPLIELIAKCIVTISIITLLVIVDTKLALIVGLSLGGAYLVVFFTVSKYLKHIGEQRLKNNELRFKTIVEAFGDTKEIKFKGLEETYISIFSKSSKIFANTQASAQVISQLPRLILEAIAFGGILLIILYIISKTGSFDNSLPIVSLYAFAGYRLMPALQSIYSSFVSLSFIGPSVDKVYEDYKNLKPLIKINDKKIIKLDNSISLNGVHYNYPNQSKVALKNINLQIPVKSVVGFVGATGSGKTTMVDIISGLLEPQKGTLEVDGKVITKDNCRFWQRSIGYVPQFIYLSDTSVAANIAFGEEPKNIKQDAVEKSAKIANLHNFVLEELNEQYQTTIGERGVRLSGGQRQRIGIARALYNNPQILILDEATSALDNLTEKLVMDSIKNYSKDLTIIIIAHRLDTVKNCDKIYLLEKGEIKKEGSFEELINSDKAFRKSVNN